MDRKDRQIYGRRFSQDRLLCENMYRKMGITGRSTLEMLLDCSQVEVIRKKQIFVHQGNDENRLFFVCSGVVRGMVRIGEYESTEIIAYRYGEPIFSGYTLNTSRHIANVRFTKAPCPGHSAEPRANIKDSAPCPDHSAEPLINTKNPVSCSELSLQALTDCVLVSISLAEYTRLMSRYDELKDLYIRWLSNALSWHVDLMHMHALSVTDRCRWFAEKHPRLAGKIQRQYIAALLNMTLSTYGKTMKKIEDAG